MTQPKIGGATITYAKPTFINKLLSPLHSIFNNKADTGIAHQLGIRHELHEVKSLPSHIRSIEKGRQPTPNGLMANSKGKAVGIHFQPSVLAREGNDVYNMPHKDAVKKLVNARRKSEEAKTINKMSGGKIQYGTKKTSGREMKQLDKVKPDTLTGTGQSYGLGHSPMPHDKAVKFTENKVATTNRWLDRLSRHPKLKDLMDSSRMVLRERSNPANY